MAVVKKGATDQTFYGVLRSTTDNTEVTGKTNTDFTLSYLRTRGTRTAVTAASLGTVDAAHSDGGVIEVDATNLPGLYRIDFPDAAFASGAANVILGAKVSGAYMFFEEIELVDNTEKDVYDRIGAPAGASIAADLVTIDNLVDDLEGRLTAARAGYLDNLSGGAVALASVCTEARLGELDAANIPADVDTILTDTGTTLENHLTDIKGTGFVKDTHSLPQCLTATGFSTHSAADIWSVGTRALTDKAGFSIAGTKTTLDALNDLSAADVNAEVDTALADIDLDHLIQVTAGAEKPTVGSYLDKIMNKDGLQTFDPTTDSLEAVRDRGDAAWITATGFSTHDAAAVRTEIDANSTQLAAIVADTNELQTDWVNGGRLDLLIDAIKAKTDNLKDSWNDLSAAQVNAEVDTAFDTAIPGTPTANSINERIKAIDDKLPTGTISDFDESSDQVIVATNNDKTGYALSSAGIDSILDEVVEGTLTMRQMLRIMLSALAGKSSGGGTATLTFRDAGDTKARITATVDANGNRTAITTDGT